MKMLPQWDRRSFYVVCLLPAAQPETDDKKMIVRPTGVIEGSSESAEIEPS
jgi:hypothetical protein